MSYFGVSTRNGVGLGLGTVPSLTNTPLGYRLAPSLDLSFAGSDALSPAITFSRTSNATLTNSAGLVTYAPHNLLTFSEQFDNAAWTKTRISVSANAVIAPDGTITADKLVEDTTASASHFTTSASASFTSGTAYTLSAYAKAGERSQFGFNMQSTVAGVDAALFNLATGSVIQNGSFSSTSITPVGNGWYRCTGTITATGTASAGVIVRLALDNATSYTGDGTSGIYIWGAQLELGSTATTYNPTTVKNLLGFTEHFDNAAWTKSSASISATKVDDIYGQPFAQKLVPTVSATDARVQQSFTGTAGAIYTLTAYAKAGEFSGARLYADDGASNLASVFYNLTTGAVTSGPSTSGTWTGASTTSTDVGNGWWRISLTWTATGAAPTRYQVRCTNTGDGTSGIYIFGAQLSDSASVDPYVYNPVAAPSSVAYYGPRFDYDPVTLAPKGLLIEEQRTNLLLNSAVLNTQVVTTTATAHTLSFYGTGTIVLSGASTGTVVGTGAYPTRTTLTFTPIVGVLTVTVTGSVTMAQLEAGAFATSYIPTVASQVTRAADNASMIGNNFARWYNQTTGTVFAQYSANGLNPGASNAAYGISDNTTANFIAGRTLSSVATNFQVRTGGADQVALNSTSVAAGAVAKSAGAYALNDFAFSTNAGTVQTDTAGTLPVVTQMQIGGLTSSVNPLNGTISRIAYYPRRLANTELQGITS